MEIDETVVVRRKYERGRVASKAQIWLFGGVERSTNGEQCFLAVIDGQRSAQNLLPMLQKYIRPGSIIYSDLWRSYNSIPNLPQCYTHFTVNHSENFIDPISGRHTQNIESLWSTYKPKFRHQASNNTGTYQTYFPEFL